MRKCGICGQPGHNRRTCKANVVEKPEPKSLGPTIMDCGHFSWWWDGEKCDRCSRHKEYEYGTD